MEDEQLEHKPEQSKEPVNVSLVERPKIDFYLQSLVNMANEHGSEFGITLVIGGTVITGTLIGGSAYFHTFADTVAAAWPGDEQAKEGIRESLVQPATLYGQGKPDEAGPSFVHLKNATIRTPSGHLPDGGMLWRGRLTEVSGFTLGSIS